MKKSAVFFLISLFLVQIVIAQTQINVRADPLTGIVIRLQDANSGAQIDSLYSKTNIRGNATTYYNGTRPEISMTIHLVKEGNIVDTKEFGPFPTSNPIYVSFIKEEPKNETVAVNSTKNETIKNETVVAEIKKEDENVKVSGAAISDFDFYIPKLVYYILGGILAVGVLGFLVFRFKDSFTGFGRTKSVHELEGELKHFQQEIARMKEIQHAEHQIERDKEELKRLKKR